MDDTMKHLYSGKVATKYLRGIAINNNYTPPPDTTLYQVVFFTRTKCNLDFVNICRDRKMSTLLNDNDNSVERYTRLMLDPKLHWNATDIVRGSHVKRKLNSDLVDPFNPFIPVLSNSLKTLSGFPDVALDTWDAAAGSRKETWGYVDGPVKIFSTFQLNATFSNDETYTVKKILDTWTTYSSAVREGTMIPRSAEYVGGRVDYQTAIYVFTLAPNRRKILEWGRTIAYPIVNPIGEVFNYNAEEPKHNGDINTVFKCYGMEYNDPILLKEFNKVCSIFNPELRTKTMNNGYRGDMVELDDSMLEAASGEAVPYIDLNYNTLEWLIHKDKLAQLEKDIDNG